MLELAFHAERRAREPVYRQLEAYLRELIEAQRLAPGERLPASRELAASLGLSRNTVNLAYQALVEDGLLHAHVGQGTFVARPAATAAGARRDGSTDTATPRPGGLAWSGLLARRARALSFPRPLARALWRGSPAVDLRAGRVDPGTLPVAELRRAFARAAEQLPALARAADPLGWPPLREAVARALVARGIACGAADVVITSGAQQGLDLVARVLVDPGDGVVVEQPGYLGAALAFSAAEAHLVGVGVDDQGLRTDELARILRTRRVKLVFTTPAVQSPTGVRLGDARRRELLELAGTYQVPIVEDDYDSELRHGSPPIPALKSLDAAGRVIYLGTFSKALLPGLRVGYLVAPQALLRPLALARFAASFQMDLLTQAALAELLAGGGLERHVRRVRRVYAERREAALAALAAHMPEGTRWTEPAGGTSVWVTLPDDVDADALWEAAGEADLAYTPGALFLEAERDRHLLLGFGGIETGQIDAAVERLGACLRVVRVGRRAAGPRGGRRRTA